MQRHTHTICQRLMVWMHVITSTVGQSTRAVGRHTCPSAEDSTNRTTGILQAPSVPALNPKDESGAGVTPGPVSR